MAAALFIILVLGICLPIGLGVLARRRKETLRPWSSPRSAIDQWLISEYRLNQSDRSVVKRSVLGSRLLEPFDALGDQPEPRKQSVDPTAVPPALVPAARALAERLLADQLPALRLNRQLGWVSLAVSALAIAYGIVATVTGWGHGRPNGGLLLVYGVVWGLVAAANAILIPRRARARARRLLAATADSAQATQR